MSTEKTPLPLTSISEMTPLPGESAQACPGIFHYLAAKFEKLQVNNPNLTSKQVAQFQSQLEAAKPLLSFFEDYLHATNPPVQATAIDKRVVITLQDSTRVQLGGEESEAPLPGSMEPSTSIQI